MTLFPDFYDTSKTQQIAVNLFYGWGYNFFKQENQLRADSALIRGKISDVLGEIRKAISDAEGAYRRRMLPLRTRTSPEPDPAVYAACGELEALGQALGKIEVANRTAPVPETDRMRQRFRTEANLLDRLVEADKRMVAQAEIVRHAFQVQAPVTGEWLLENIADIRAAFAALAKSMRERSALLTF